MTRNFDHYVSNLAFSFLKSRRLNMKSRSVNTLV